MAAPAQFGGQVDAPTHWFARDRLYCWRWRRAIAHDCGQVEWRFGIKFRHKRRRRPAECGPLAGRGVPQHDWPWLITIGGLADVDLLQPPSQSPTIRFCQSRQPQMSSMLIGSRLQLKGRRDSGPQRLDDYPPLRAWRTACPDTSRCEEVFTRSARISPGTYKAENKALPA
jgi:hypothetical protein